MREIERLGCSWGDAARRCLATALVAGAAIVVAGCVRKPVPSSPPPAAAPATPAERAVALYDEGRYSEARVALEELDAAGALGGALLYRLAFCHGDAGDPAKQAATMARALAALEVEAKTRTDLETGFFLANAQTNLGKAAEAKATAAGITARLESGALPPPTRPLDQFRVGKLYADQGRTEPATRWYRTALEGFGRGGGAAMLPYARWARRWLGQEAFLRGAFEDAEREYAGLAATGGATVAEYDRLAVARARLGRWSEAAEAWRAAERLDPASADRPRYCRNLAGLASGAGEIPKADPTGKPWSDVAKEDLERTMAVQARVVREGRGRASETPPPDAAELGEIAARLAGARSLFVAAALEYVYRNHDIRETSFLGGYAPLIFHPGDWGLPEREP